MEIRPYLRSPHFYETDGMNIVHHANYIHWMEEARVDFMSKMGFGYDRTVEEGIDLALVSLSCHYCSMTRFGETVRIQLSIDRLTPARVTVSYRMEDAATGELRCEAMSEHCFFSRAKGRPVALKRDLPELYQKFQALCKQQKE